MKKKNHIIKHGITGLLLVFCLFSFIACSSDAKSDDSSSSSISSSDLESLREEADNEMSYYYFDSYDYVSYQYDKSRETIAFTYNATFSGTNYSYDGKVTLASFVFPDEDGSLYADEWSINYKDSFDWNISGYWASLSPTFEIKIDSVNQTPGENGTINYNATAYGGETPKAWDEESESTGDVEGEMVVDYTGNDTLFVGRKIVSSDDEEEPINYDCPRLSFEMELNGLDYVVVVNPDKVTCTRGNADIITGELTRNSRIEVVHGENYDQYGYPDYKLVETED